MTQYCVGCHNERNKAAVSGFALDAVDVKVAGQRGDVWEKVVTKLRAEQMPPLHARRPERAVSNSVAAWLESELDRHAAARPNPGRTEALHRLSRTEYKNAVRDLLGLQIDVENLLPPDPLGGGDANFDNIASSLRMSQSLLERYLTVARRVSRTAMSGHVPPNIQTFKVPQGLQQDIRLDGMPFGSRGGLAVDYAFPLDAVYKIDVMLGSALGGGTFGGPQVAGEFLELSLDGEQVREWAIIPPAESGGIRRGRPPSFTMELPVKAGAHRLLATFRKVRPAVEQEGDRLAFASQQLPGNPVIPGVTSVIVAGPLQVLGKGDTPSRRRILTCAPKIVTEEETCARQILTRLARREVVGPRRPTTSRT